MTLCCPSCSIQQDRHWGESTWNIWCVCLFSPPAGHKCVTSRLHCLRLLIAIPDVSFCLQQPGACRILVDSKTSIILYINCRLFTRVSPPRVVLASDWLIAIYSSKSEASILVSIWVLYFTYHNTDTAQTEKLNDWLTKCNRK